MPPDCQPEVDDAASYGDRMAAGKTPMSVHEPQGSPKGGVVVVQEAFGVNGHIEDVGRRLAGEGWLAVAPHLFHRRGDPTFGYDDIAAVMPLMRRLKADQILDDVDAALAHLAGAGIPPASVGVVGFCMGGTVALATAARRDVGAAVTFYGGGVTIGRFGFDPLVEEVARLRAPWLGLFGDRDKGIPVNDVVALAAAAEAAPQPTEVVRYPDAGHGFHCDERPDHHEASATDAWRRTLDWLDRHLEAPPGA
jgi:carboxymethylenebutenolidase